MRTSLCVIAALGSLGAAALAAGAGCGSLPDDCLLLLTCPTTGGGAGGGEPTPDACIPSKNPGKPLDDACGIFVTSGPKGADRATGSKGNPLKTLAAAVAKAKLEGRRPIYACAEAFSEPLSSDTEIELYGGLDCDRDWSYIGNLKKTTLTADADQIPLTLAKESKVADFAIVAKDAMGAGQSSIAVVADQAKVSFARCEITAGSGAAGLPGATPDAPVGPPKQTDAEVVGYDGQDASCSGTNQTPGGMQKQSMYCMGRTIGGNGGGGDKTQGYAGAASSSADEYTALGGAGQASTDASLDCANPSPKGGHGSNGATGPAGADGDGAKDDALGSIDASGYKGAPGKDGGDGVAGKGGGGGGGAKGKGGTCFGASGGGGGVGGCGGGGGKGGGGGGSSIGIIGLTAQLTFDAVTIKVADGGKGGDGGDGQPGGLGGRGGNGGAALTAGSVSACNGGDGGNGGNGGKGGGGRGGHSIGIAYTSATDQEMPGVQITIGMAGVGGKSVDASKSAVAGLKAERQRF